MKFNFQNYESVQFPINPIASFNHIQNYLRYSLTSKLCFSHWTLDRYQREIFKWRKSLSDFSKENSGDFKMINKKMQKLNLNKFLLVSNKYSSEKNFKKINHIKDIIKELNCTLGQEAIDKIMRTHKDYRFGFTFLKFLELHRKIGIKEINKYLNIDNPRLVEDWYRRYPPRPIRTLLNIYFSNYHKISQKNLGYLFGWGYGDGGLSSELSYYFVCGKKHDLYSIKRYLISQIPHIKIVIQRNEGHNIITLYNGQTKLISGKNSWILYVRDSSFCKLLYSLGLPKGNKVLQETRIPEWILKGNKDIKISFLNALFEGELQKHKVQYNIKKNKIEICPIIFGLSKIDKYKSNLIDFLNEIRTMLKEFNVNSTEVEKPKPSNIRKDRLITYSSRFYISISALNTIRFSKIFDFPFNQEKKNALFNSVKEAKRKITNMNLQVIKYNRALKLFEEGSSLYKIARELNIEYNTAKNWLKNKEHLPVLLNQNGVGILDEV